jgi:AcrR family transcriptional regulator
MPRAGLTADAVIERGAELLEQGTTTELTLAAVADSLGVRTPSLYKHVDGLPGLRRGMMLRAKARLTAALERATVGRSGDDAIRSLAGAYRRWALDNPAQYPLTIQVSGPGVDEEDDEVSGAALQVIYDVLAGYQLAGEDAVDATRYLRSTIHGFVSLETGGSFRMPIDLERSYDKLIDAVVIALANWTR